MFPTTKVYIKYIYIYIYNYIYVYIIFESVLFVHFIEVCRFMFVLSRLYFVVLGDTIQKYRYHWYQPLPLRYQYSIKNTDNSQPHLYFNLTHLLNRLCFILFPHFTEIWCLSNHVHYAHAHYKYRYHTRYWFPAYSVSYRSENTGIARL